MSRENKFARELSRFLKDRGALVASYVASEYGVAGFPDKIVWSVHWCGLMELKTGDNELSPKQLYVLRELDARQAWSAVQVREVDGVQVCAVTRHLRDKTSETFTCGWVDLLKSLKMRCVDGL